MEVGLALSYLALSLSLFNIDVHEGAKISKYNVRRRHHHPEW